MIETSCMSCGGKILLPDPPPNTQQQNIDFRRAWDARVDRAKEADMAKKCTHVRKGIVTNQNPDEPHDPEQPHASISTCDRDGCLRYSIQWVAGKTNQTATFYPDSRKRTS